MAKTFFIVVCVISIVCIQSCVSPSKHEPKKPVVHHNVSTTNQLQLAFVAATNKARSKARMCGDKKFPAAPALALNNKLNQAAYLHSLDMYENQFLEHSSSNGNTLVERMRNESYSWRAVAENIAHNQKNIAQVIEDWLSSPGHCSNIMSADFTETGIAQVNRYWTQVYAAPK